ncbi:MAG: type II toxin-antitoxin system RelE/ParE family toxin [Candidatus Symbiobacter sp.]|nr:type II toxin-antitoxin system RelE/ParE family toxin [Candidatus Symbiobacter sp.]
MSVNWQSFLTTPARKDFEEIFAYTSETWGVGAANRYIALIELTIKNLRENPNRFGISVLDGFDSRVKSCPLKITNQKSLAHKIKRPRHVIYFQTINPPLIEILRILHDRMDVTDKIG